MKKKLSNKEKQKSTMKQCCFLDQDGKRCRKRTALKKVLHLQVDLYNYPRWVEANLCVDHCIHLDIPV